VTTGGSESRRTLLGRPTDPLSLASDLERRAESRRPFGLAALATAVLDLVFPALCPVCQTRLGAGRRDPLCGRCWDAIERIAPPYCDACGMPGAPCCARCAAEPRAWDYARSAACYEGRLREALHAFKFGGRRALARPLGDLLVEQCAAALPPGIAGLVPVPLAWERERERGFNQARLLAERLAPRLGTTLRPRWAVRVRTTRPQSDLSAEERRANVRGAFRASAAAAGQHVLLVDDVFTTGATLDACARALRDAGAARIGVLTVARVI
jgi:ComF family protein